MSCVSQNALNNPRYLFEEIYFSVSLRKRCQRRQNDKKGPFSRLILQQTQQVFILFVVSAYFHEIHFLNLSRCHKGGLSRTVGVGMGVSLVLPDSKLRRPSLTPPSLESPKSFPVRQEELLQKNGKPYLQKNNVLDYFAF